MNKLMMTVASVALMAVASPVLAQSSPNGPATAPIATPNPGTTAPNNSSTNMPQDTTTPNAASQDQMPMSSKDSTSAANPGAQSGDMGTGDTSDMKSTRASHHMHHSKTMHSSKASGNKGTDHDAEQLNQQELGKIQSPKT